MRILTASILALTVVACSSSSPSTTSTTSTTSTPPSSSTTAAPTTTTAAPPNTGGGPSGTDLAGAIFEKTTIDTFRTRTEVRVSNDPEGNRTVVHSVIDAAYQRDPEAVSVGVVIDDRQNVSIIGVGDRYFLDDGSGWSEEPLARQVLSLASTSLLAPETVAVILPLLDEVGEEAVAGRAAVHYQGGPETLQVLINATDDPAFASFTEIEYASIDLWVDKAGFLAKAIYDFGGVRPSVIEPEYYTANFEILEYDGPVMIESPLP